MKKNISLLVLLSMILIGCNQVSKQESKLDWAIAIHGGAGNMDPANFTPEELANYKNELNNALQIGKEILANGGASLDAVEQVVRYMEDCPLFNAGKGAVFNHDGKNELDASIMEGDSLKAGAVAGVGDIKNPISAARMVMEKSKHVLLVGKGASIFAKENGAEIVDSSYFFTEKSWKALQRAQDREKKMGTVGCVALDKNGNLAAATSTGGMTNKRFGRIGDSPIIGAGTYANNETCAVSATGHGEFFIRYTVAHDISALMQYKNYTLKDAVNTVLMDKLVKAKGSGGIIAVDKFGNIELVMNTTGMFRGYSNSKGDEGILIFKK